MDFRKNEKTYSFEALKFSYIENREQFWKWGLLLAAVLFFYGSIFFVASYGPRPSADYAVAEDLLCSFGARGQALVRFKEKTAYIRVELRGLAKDAFYGLHIKEFADLATNTSTGEHYNPSGAKHGCPRDGAVQADTHAGDLGNAGTNSFGNADLYLRARFEQPSRLLGRVVAVSENGDDCVAQPQGNSGADVAACVIGYASDRIERSDEDFGIK